MSEQPPTPPRSLRARHLVWGWGALLAFVIMGLVLEGMHGWKARLYLDAAFATRRLLWTLAHAHGSLVAIVNVIFALTVAASPARGRGLRLTSACLICANVLLPAGFFLGGLTPYGGDPGLGILLVPPGALALVVGLAAILRAVLREERARASEEPERAPRSRKR